MGFRQQYSRVYEVILSRVFHSSEVHYNINMAATSSGKYNCQPGGLVRGPWASSWPGTRLSNSHHDSSAAAIIIVYLNSFSKTGSYDNFMIVFMAT